MDVDVDGGGVVVVAVDVVAVLEAVCLDMHAYVYLTFLSGLLDMHVCVSELRNTNVYKTKNKNKNKVSEFLHPCKFHSLIYLSFTPHNGCRAASVKIALFVSVLFFSPLQFPVLLISNGKKIRV